MDRLKKDLQSSLKGAERVAIVGIGSSLRGDDAAGPLFIEELRAALRGAKETLPLKLFSCETAPENYTGDIRKFNPTHIIIVDAIDMGRQTGWTGVVDLEKTGEQVSFSTHRLPINMLVEYLKQYLKCRIITIGIQPESVDFSSPLCDNVRNAVRELRNIVLESLINRKA
jgi:hydrogenase 3 maturation protease